MAVKALGPTTWLHQTFQAFLKIEVELICVSDIGQSNSVNIQDSFPLYVIGLVVV